MERPDLSHDADCTYRHKGECTCEKDMRHDPYSLPNIEVFHSDDYPCEDDKHLPEDICQNPGWYWWTCLPGCLPDGDPNGPFATYEEALADAQGENDNAD